jgi:hypothetical protein
VKKLVELKSAHGDGKWVDRELGKMILGLSHIRFAKKGGRWAWWFGLSAVVDISGEDVPLKLGVGYGGRRAASLGAVIDAVLG